MTTSENKDFFFDQNQAKLPIFEALKNLADKPNAPFYAPGHKRGEAIPQVMADLLGKKVFNADLPELPGLDNLFAPEGVIQEAQKLAAQTFKADQTWFLINGSSCGIIASILATCNAGDKLIIPRNVHQSVVAGLILSGAIPIFINPEYDPITDLIYSITPTNLQATLSKHPDAKAVLIVYPTYQGICGDIETLIEITHSYHIPFLVDEAHAAHFLFHADLPDSALSVGADLSVQSTHKVLGSMTQSSMVHVRGDRLDRQRINKALQLVQSTSPNYILLASLDAARQQMAFEGQKLLTKTLELSALVREKLQEIDKISVLNFEQPKPGFHKLDSTRLTIDITKLGLSGYQGEKILHHKFGVTPELPLFRHLTFILSIGNTEDDINKLVEALKILAKDDLSPLPSSPPPIPLVSELDLSPREAFFAPSIDKAIKETIGYISAEVVCPYPPGIPVLMPGEKITEDAVMFLQKVKDFGANITGCSDGSLQTLKVVK